MLVSSDALSRGYSAFCAAEDGALPATAREVCSARTAREGTASARGIIVDGRRSASLPLLINHVTILACA